MRGVSVKLTDNFRQIIDTMSEVYYTDERTNSLWLGINPRGAYIDMKRISDGFTLNNLHCVGHQMHGIPGYYQHAYRNKSPWVQFQFKTIFVKKGIPCESD